MQLKSWLRHRGARRSDIATCHANHVAICAPRERRPEPLRRLTGCYASRDGLA